MIVDWDTAQDAALDKLQSSVNEQLRRQYLNLVESMQGFLHDLLNYPLERPWRQTLTRFTSHWENRGLKLSSRTVQSLEELLSARLDRTKDLQFAEVPASNSRESFATDAALDVASKSVEGKDGSERFSEERKKRTREFLRQREAKALSEDEKLRLGLTENERIRLEFFLVESLRRAEDNEAPLPAPDFWYDANQRLPGTGR